MASLTHWEKERIIEELEAMSVESRSCVLASVDAFSSWLSNRLYFIYKKLTRITLESILRKLNEKLKRF